MFSWKVWKKARIVNLNKLLCDDNFKDIPTSNWIWFSVGVLYMGIFGSGICTGIGAEEEAQGFQHYWPAESSSLYFSPPLLPFQAPYIAASHPSGGNGIQFGERQVQPYCKILIGLRSLLSITESTCAIWRMVHVASGKRPSAVSNFQ